MIKTKTTIMDKLEMLSEILGVVIQDDYRAQRNADLQIYTDQTADGHQVYIVKDGGDEYTEFSSVLFINAPSFQHILVCIASVKSDYGSDAVVYMSPDIVEELEYEIDSLIAE